MWDRCSRLRGKEHENVSEVAAGDIGAVAKLTHTHTGDTLSTKDDPVQLPAIDLPEPLLAYAVEPKTKGDEDKLSTGLARLREEDPTLRVARSDETHETVMYGMGEAHLEVQMERLKRKFGVEVTTHPAKIAYRETIKKKAKGLGRHVKQTGGHGQYAVCNIELEPVLRGEGFVYENKIFGGAIPSQFISSIEKGIVKTMSDGVISGNPMVDIKVILTDGKFHPVDSSDMAFQIAGSLALKDAVEAAGVVLLEPVVDLEVIVPEAYTGDIMGDLNSKRGKIGGMEQIGGGKQRIHAQVPQAEVARYVIDLRSMTGGRGAFSMAFSHYEELPTHLAAEGHRGVSEGPRGSAEEVAMRSALLVRLRLALARNPSTSGRTPRDCRRFTRGPPPPWSPCAPRGRPRAISSPTRRMTGGSCSAITTSVGTSISPSRWAAGGSSSSFALSSIVISCRLSNAIRRISRPAASSVPERRPDLELELFGSLQVPRLDRRVDRGRNPFAHQSSSSSSASNPPSAEATGHQSPERDPDARA